jgi:hypothetical protein
MALTRPRSSQMSTTVVDLTDPIIRLNKDQVGSNIKDIGFIFERGNDTNTAFIWDQSASEFVLINTNEVGATEGNVAVISYANIHVATVIGDVTGDVTGTVSDISNHTTDNLAEGSNLYYTNDRVSSYLGANDYDTATNIIASITALAPSTLDTLNELAASLNDDADFAGTVTTSLSLKAPIASPTFTGTVSGITSAMIGLGNVTNESKSTMFANPTFTGTINAPVLRLYDADNSNYVAFTSPSVVSTNITWTLPAIDGEDGQLLRTDGLGTLSWIDSGGGGAPGFYTSSIVVAPGTDNNYDLAESPDQDGDETPFTTSGNDAFGVSLSAVYDNMEPVGRIITFDYGSSEAYVGA